MELLFLSFTTLSSTGLGDVLPVRPFARALVMLEMVVGVGYIAMVVSRLVTLLVQCNAGHPGDRGPWPGWPGGPKADGYTVARPGKPP